MPRHGLSRFLAHSVLVVAVSGLVVGVAAVTPAVAAQQDVASAEAVTQQASVTTVSARAGVASLPVAASADVWVVYARGLKFQDCYNIGEYLVDLGEAAAFKCIAQGSFFTLVILVPPICVAALPAAKLPASCP
jgi:hypothetical protein